MYDVKKKILSFLAIVMLVGSFHEVLASENVSWLQKKQERLGRYWDSDAGITKALDYTVGIGVSVGFAFLYMYLQQKPVDFIGNQTINLYYPGNILVTFDDVAGLAGAKADMRDIINYVKNPAMYKSIGAKIPRGILMNGAPGNGKTLLAKAFAGEVNCPFISVSGSSFVQMYIGLGAERVRFLFKIAQQLAQEYGACIIFIDEIDAVAQRRSFGGSCANKEHDQTVTQLLACMDGLEKSVNPIIVLGATNRAELLDPAMIRPGRFDRKVEITKPAFKDRVELIKIALKEIRSSFDINLNNIARVTAGFSGAELSNLINEAAIVAVNDGRNVVTMKDIDLAFDNITLGREVKGMELTDDDRWITAVHEAGHAVGWVFGNSKLHAVHKASITPRTGTLGIVHAVQLYEAGTVTESEMRAMIIMSLCGGLSEQEFGFDKSTGLLTDLAKARAIAYDMVVCYGMADKSSYLLYEDDSQSEAVAQEVQKIIDECYLVAQSLIASHKKEIEMIAKLLMEKGTVVGKEIYELLDVPSPIIFG